MQNNIKYILILLFFLVHAHTSYAQQNIVGYPIINNLTDIYNPYLSSPSWSIVQDKNNYIIAATHEGIIIYDGISWQLIQLPEQLACKKLSQSPDGKIYVGTTGGFGYLDYDEDGKYKYFSLSDSVFNTSFKETWSIAATTDSVVFIPSDTLIYSYKSNHLQKIPIKPYLQRIRVYTVNNKMIFTDDKFGILQLKNGILDTISTQPLLSGPIYSINKFDKERILVTTSNDGLWIAEVKENGHKITMEPFRTNVDNKLKKSFLYNCTFFNDTMFVLSSLRDGIYVIGKSGYMIDHLTKQTGLKTNTNYCTFKDKSGNLWVGSVSGISSIMYDIKLRISNNLNGLSGAITSLSIFNGYIYVGTSVGLFFAKLDKKNSNIKFNLLDDKYIFTHQFLQVTHNNGKKILLGATYKELFYIDENNKTHIISPLIYPEELKKDFYDSTIIYISYYHGIAKMYIKENGKIYFERKIPYINDYVFHIEFDNRGNLWAATDLNGIFMLRFDSGKISQIYELKNFPYKKFLFLFKYDGKLYVSDKHHNKYEIFEKNGKPYYKKINFLPNILPQDINILSATEDDSGNLYLVTDLGFYLYDKKLNKIKWSFNNRMFRVKQFYYVFTKAHGSYWLAINESLYNFNNFWIDDINSFKIYFPKIHISDSIVFEGNKLLLRKDRKNIVYRNKIPQSQNNITIYYTTRTYLFDGLNRYKYKLEGYDKQWSKWTTYTKKEYTNLPAGTYTFKVKAINAFGKESDTYNLTFTITAPFYKTTPAYILYFIIIMLILYYWHKRRMTVLKKRKDELEKIVKDRISEINQQKEEILAQSEKLKRNQDVLKLINKELKHLSLVAQKTENSVVILDARGKFEWWNRAFTQIFSHKFAELEGKSFREREKFLRKDLKEKIKKFDKKSKKSIEYETREVLPNGEDFYYKTTITPVYDDQDVLFRFVVVDVDITTLKRAQKEIESQAEELKAISEQLLRQRKILEKQNRELKRLSIVARATDNAVMFLDINGVPIWINEGFTRMYGYSLEKLKENNYKIFLQLRPELTDKIIEIVQIGKSVVYTSSTITLFGTKIFFQTTLTPIFDSQNNISYFFLIDTDITKIKLAELEIKEKSDEIAAQRDKIAKQNEEIIKSLEAAANIINAIKPTDLLLDAVIPERFILHLPLNVVGGDFFFVAHKNGKTLVTVADATGHGVSAALMAMLGYMSIKEVTSNLDDFHPDVVLNEMRERIIYALHQRGKSGEAKDGMDMAVIVIDEKNSILEYSGANNRMILVRQTENDKVLFEFKPDKMPLGIHALMHKPFRRETFHVEKNDMIYLFSDGYIDQFGGPKGKKFKIRRFRHLLMQIADKQISIQKDILFNEFEHWKGKHEQIDDIMVLGFRYI